MKCKVFDLNNKLIEEIDVKDSVFTSHIFPDIIHSYLRFQTAKKREGNHKTKTRNEVRGKSKKPFSQKGTGNARQGSSKAPHFRGGGIAFGPVVRDHSIKLNKKQKKLALKCVLSEKFKRNEVVFLSDQKLENHKTKDLNNKISNFKFNSAIFISNNSAIDKNFSLASSNIPKVSYLTVEALNVKDILKYEKLFIFKNAINSIEERLL
ncbi:MAG: 50S ribosomal protein L4 [Pelagibacteraceae bacterium]|nr:50S ribosomal protein L4 [Pelagibacteraceae bacterium]PPR51769.1 MAG: 50S ribosomal protein L4 [Alphaproteobacteria bacterium MarineAlpha5_Bin10]|tara:strand:- start:1675 stop:2298 length:624 start_codon:yes stop_codon:yes gene_type:complete